MKASADTTRMTGIFSQIDMLSSALNLSEQQHRVLSQNLANANTVGYKTQGIDFRKALAELANSEAGGNTQAEAAIEISEIKGLPERMDGNNVDLATQVSHLKKNALIYQSFTHILAAKVATMRKSITG